MIILGCKRHIAYETILFVVTLFVAKVISRRKHNKPAVKVSIAAMNNSAVILDKLTSNSEPTNKTTIAAQTNKPQIVQKVMAQ